jgi:hypothetical protein
LAKGNGIKSLARWKEKSKQMDFKLTRRRVCFFGTNKDKLFAVGTVCWERECL